MADFLDTNGLRLLWEKIKALVLGKTDKVSNATNGNFAGLDTSGNLTDSGYSPSDFALASTITTRHVVDQIAEMTSEQVDALSEGDVVIANDFAYFVGVKSNNYCYLLDSANRQMREYIYIKRGQTWYYLELRVKNPPSLVSVVGITNITNSQCDKTTGGDLFNDSNTKKNYIVAFKDLTELFLIYVDITIVEKVLYQKINNSWTYVQTDIISLSSISDVANKADKVSVVTLTGTSVTQELADNTIYQCSTLNSLTISIPNTVTPDYISQINFTSGSTATTLTAPNTILWRGDDVSNGVFVPVANKRYVISLCADGTYAFADVKGYA